MPSCPVCNHNMTVRKEWLWRCPSCGFLSSTLSAGAGPSVVGIEALRQMNFETLLDRLERISPLAEKTLLEVGCSTGLFLDAASRRGAKVTGVEPEKEKVSQARSKGFEIIGEFFPEALPAGQTFDVIVFNDVFEHLPDPVVALHACAAHLNPDGILVLNLPDSKGMLYFIANTIDRLGIDEPLKRLWQMDFPSPHLSYFNRDNLKTLSMTKAGLELVHQSSLKTLTTAGLKDRINATINRSALRLMMYIGLLILVPLQCMLPSDILLQIYRKKRSPIDGQSAS